MLLSLFEQVITDKVVNNIPSIANVIIAMMIMILWFNIDLSVDIAFMRRNNFL